MNTLLSADVARLAVQDRHAQALLAGRAARLLAARRWQRRADVAARRARLARLAVH